MRYSIISPTEYRLYSVGWNESDELGIAVGYGIKKGALVLDDRVADRRHAVVERERA